MSCTLQDKELLIGPGALIYYNGTGRYKYLADDTQINTT